MKKIISVVSFLLLITACNNAKSKKQEPAPDKRIMLRADTLNVVKMTDTMVIYESTCRGCAYENSTHFAIADTLGIVELDHVETHDNSRPDMDGGSIAKYLVIVPKKTGTTTMKMYKFWEKPATAKDSANATTYTIEVKN